MNHQRVAELFDQVTELPIGERAAWIAAACAGDEALRAELESLLRADERANRFMERPPTLIAVAASAAQSEPQPRQFGPYAVLRQIGVGGMGEVWLAERSDGEFEQRVAIKQLAYPTPGLLQRFRQERQILARLEHPHIARLIDGGVATNGAPYLVMEYVEGVPITDFAREHALDAQARLRLFLRVCEAVQYAHQNLIVHRDLKPSNIFVTVDGLPKLLDFGIAKVLTTTGADAPTQTVARMFTPDYAAPEQFNGGPITTATDVYALGVVLYELLAGTKPRRALRFGATAAETGPTSEPSPPSAAIERTTGDAPARRRALRGDLDRVVLTALASDVRRRYPSAEALAADIRRTLDGRPIAARGDSRTYRLHRFVMRHRYALAATLLIFAVCVAATVVSVQQAGRAREQAAHADAVRQFLVGVFEQARPDENRGKPVTAHQLLEAGEKQLAGSTRDKVATRADLTGLIGSLYWDVGDYKSAESLLRQSVAMSDDSRVPDEVKARSLHWLARAENEKNAFDAATTHAERSLAFAQRAGRGGTNEASEARRMLAQARIGQGNAKDAEPLLLEALTSDRTGYGERSQAVIDDLLLLGFALKELSRYDEAVSASREAIDVATVLHGRLHSGVVNGLETLASAQGHQGDYVASERNLREAVSIAEQVFGNEHRETTVARSNLLWTLETQGRYAEALQGRLTLLEIEKKMSETRPEQGAYAYNFLATDYQGLGRFAEAEAASRKSLAIWASIQGATIEWDSSDALNNLAIVLLLQGRYADAEAAFRHEIAIQREHELPTSEWLGRSRGYLGTVQRLDHRPAAAVREISEAFAALAPAGTKASPIRAQLQAQLAEAQLDAGDATTAASTAASALIAMRTAVPTGNLKLGLPLFALARAELARGRAREAEPLLREALAARSPPYPDHDPRVLEVQIALVNALAKLGKLDEAHALSAAIEPLLRTWPSPYAADLRARLASH